MYVFRIHIRPSGGSADMESTFAYCYKHNLLGVGWRTESNKCTTKWDEYFEEASKIHDDLRTCEYIEKLVGRDDLVWTRDTAGEYYLAKVLSGWEYWVNEEAINKDIDVGNIFRVQFHKVSIDMVPGKVVACFRPQKTIQKILDEKAVEYSKYLWNSLVSDATYEIEKSKFSDVFMMLDDEETEDLVFLYLQSKGWFVVPNSRKGDSMSFEYLAIHPKTHEKALTQVKTGNVHLDRDEYSNYPYKIFLFQANGLYDGKESKNIECISPKELHDFFQQSLEWLPRNFRSKYDLVMSE